MWTDTVREMEAEDWASWERMNDEGRCTEGGGKEAC